MSWGYDRQIQAHDKLLSSRGGVLWWKVGQGKTRICIHLFLSLCEVYKWPWPTICVVVLRRVAFVDFRLELIQLGIDAVVLEDDAIGLPEATQIAMLQKPTFLLTSAGSLSKSVDQLLVDKRVRMTIVSELHMFKNPKAERSKKLRRLTMATKAVGESGSLITAQKIEDIFGQLWAICKERYVAENMTKFRSEFLKVRMIEGKTRSWPQAFPATGAFKKLMDRVNGCADIYFPPKSDRKVKMQTLSVEATLEQKRAFADLNKWMEVEVGGRIHEYVNTLQVALKLQEISNGWLKDKDGRMWEIPSNKYDRLGDMAQQLIEQGEQLVVWCAFKHDVKRVVAHLTKLGIATLQFTSEAPFEHDVWTKRQHPVVVATEAIGSSVNHFAQVAYACYFSMDYHWLHLQQSMGRTDRVASKHPEVFYYFLQVAGSLDNAIYRRVLESRDRENMAIALGEELGIWRRQQSTQLR